MSTPDPRTEVAAKIIEKHTAWISWQPDHIQYMTAGEKDNLLKLITDALTTEAARVRGEERNRICRQLAERADELGASADAAILQGDLSAPSDEQAYAAQQFKSMAKHLRVEAMEYRPATPKPSPWSTARPTVAGWYWWRSLKGNEPEAVHLIDPDIVMLAGDDRIFSPSQMVNGIPGEWCPIARPE